MSPTSPIAAEMPTMPSGPTMVTPTVRPSAIVTDSATSARFREEDAPNRRMRVDKGSLCVQTDTLEVAR